MENRFKNGYETFLVTFLQAPVFIICPTCSGKAIVKNFHTLLIEGENIGLKVVCTKCGFSKTGLEKTNYLIKSKNGKTSGFRNVIGQPIDPVFHYPLWLTTEFGKHLIWAYNPEHLNFLKEYISSTLRERNTAKIFNSSLGSRLPKWMISKTNRENILKKISELENKL